MSHECKGWAEHTAVADLNLDGLSDLFISRINARDQLFLGTADTTFFVEVTGVPLVDSSLPHTHAAVGDVNLDGRPDLLVSANHQGSHVRNELYLHDPINDGIFVKVIDTPLAVQHDISGQYRMSAIADLNQDGRVDVYMVASTGNKLFLHDLINDGEF